MTEELLLDDDDDIIFDDGALAQIDAVERAVTTGVLPRKTSFVMTRPAPSTSTAPLKQKTLFGGTVASKAAAPKPVVQAAKTRATKRWDFGSFARLGWSKKRAVEAKAKAKGKKKAYASDQEPWDEDEEVLEDDDDDDDGFVIDPAENVDGERNPMKWPPDSEAIKTWHYPVQADKPLRSYQHTIAYKCLVDNTLVSLPTGLGKTFIAACVMLNYFRWYPEGKIIFLAPTRPLVTQQIKACHYIAGIPQSACIELTGQTPAKLRGVAWATKRVIYCTPQTLENDLKKGRVDPRDVVCLVIDEAHRASGDYAYCGVVRFIMSRNEHFRVLALTATPGARGEAVQAVIDNLHIGHVEVRSEQSLDIKQYIHQKEYDLCVIPLNNTPIAAIRDKLATVMSTYIQPLIAARLIWDGNATMLAPFSVQRAYGEVKKLPGGPKANGKYFPMIKALHALTRAMELLLVHSVSCCDETIASACAENKNLASKPDIAQLRSDIRALRGMPGYVGHPKMQRLRQMCEEHFRANGADDTRIMIFCNYRDVVEEIVNCLNMLKPTIKATPFIGQGTAKGVKGKTQKEQIETIRKFKQGVYNVLVATSIGEEGLDIGEIDLIVCYEANKSPVRMLQRVGRTGRARDGKIIVLMSEGREERNWDKAKDAYSEVQNALTSHKVFDLYCDGDRMLPPDVKPECVKVEVKALELDLNAITMAGQQRLVRKHTAAAEAKSKASSSTKTKRDAKLNVPKDAFMGFRQAGELAHETKRKSAKSAAEIMRERKTAALLNVDEEVELRKWQFVGATEEKVKPVAIDTYNLPLASSSSTTATGLIGHGRRHDLVVQVIEATSKISEEKEDAFDAWHASMSAVFNADLVQPWERALRRGRPKPKDPDMRRYVVQPSTPRTFTQNMLSSCSSDMALKRTSSGASAVGLDAGVAFDARKSTPKPNATAKEMASGGSNGAIKDPSGILASSSEDDDDDRDLPELVKPNRLRSVHPAGGKSGSIINNKGKSTSTKPESTSTDYGLNDLDFDLDVDAIAKIERQFAVSQPAKATPVPLSHVAKPLSQVVKPPLPTVNQVDEDDIEIPDSENDSPKKHKVLTRDLLNSEYDLVLSDDDHVAVDADAEMLPPALPLTHKKPIAADRPRHQRHIVPDSSSSAGRPPPPAVAVNDRVMNDSNDDDDSPVKVAAVKKQKRRLDKKKKATNVIESSSSSESSREDDGEAARPRKKLRRAGERRLVETDENAGMPQTEEGKDTRRQKRRRRRPPKATDKDKAKNAMLDFEAVNSGASGTEASTESYDSENSIDRDFVDDADADAERSLDPDQEAFYRESVMMTQHPAFAPNPWKRNLLERREPAVDSPGRKSSPDSRRTQDDWSYDSFCVRDDDPIEEDTSSQA